MSSTRCEVYHEVSIINGSPTEMLLIIRQLIKYEWDNRFTFTLSCLYIPKKTLIHYGYWVYYWY